RLFEPRTTFRIGRGDVFVTYSLKSAPKDKKAQVEILDQSGAVVRKLNNAPAKEGMNRVEWDMHYDPPTWVALRTPAPQNPHICEERRFRGAESRPITHWGIEEAEVGPLAAPGKYTIKLTVDGQSFTKPVTIVKEPRAPGSDADLESTF